MDQRVAVGKPQVELSGELLSACGAEVGKLRHLPRVVLEAKPKALLILGRKGSEADWVSCG